MITLRELCRLVQGITGAWSLTGSCRCSTTRRLPPAVSRRLLPPCSCVMYAFRGD